MRNLRQAEVQSTIGGNLTMLEDGNTIQEVLEVVRDSTVAVSLVEKLRKVVPRYTSPLAKKKYERHPTERIPTQARSRIKF